MDNPVSEKAVLAPVPWIRLKNGLSVFDNHGQTAFGTKMKSFFQDLDQRLEGVRVPVFIYPSKSGSDPNEVPERMYGAWYVGSSSPDGPFGQLEVRADQDDPQWIWFWAVEGLEELKVKWADLSLGYKPNFVPRSPMLVQTPVTGP
jgi:hypothetical protein